MIKYSYKNMGMSWFRQGYWSLNSESFSSTNVKKGQLNINAEDKKAEADKKAAEDKKADKKPAEDKKAVETEKKAA